MAHKGHFGPVAFRRDLNLNVETNDAGWYRRQLWTAKLLPAGIASIISGKVFDCGPETYPAVDQIEWSSNFVLYGIARYKVQLVATINASGSGYFKEGGLFVQGQGIIWHWTYTDTDPPRPGFIQNVFPHTDFYSTDWWDSEPQGRSINTFGKLWSNGPPH